MSFRRRYAARFAFDYARLGRRTLIALRCLRADASHTRRVTLLPMMSYRDMPPCHACRDAMPSFLRRFRCRSPPP